MGVVTGIIYALDVTLQYGEGTADTKHFQPLLERAAKNCNFDIVVVDKGYYHAHNFAFCMRRNWIPFVWTKQGVVIENADQGRELLAFMDWLRRKHYHVWVRFYRLRPLIEAVFSSQKRKTGHVRFRVRTWERARIKAMRYPHKIPKGAPQLFHDFRNVLCRMIAMERVGYAQRSEALLKAIGANIRAIVRLEKEYGDVIRFEVGGTFKPMRRVTLPKPAD